MEKDELVKIWSKHLSIEVIEYTDDFFFLGGDSVDAANILIEIKERTGLELPLSRIYTYSVLNELHGIIQGLTEPTLGANCNDQ